MWAYGGGTPYIYVYIYIHILELHLGELVEHMILTCSLRYACLGVSLFGTMMSADEACALKWQD